MVARQLKMYENIALDPSEIKEIIDFNEIFPVSGPVHIEIGSGRGTFLVNQAKFDQNTNFLGIEWASKYYRYSVDRIGRWGLSNVRVMRTDAAAFISEHVKDESVDCFHIYFPDPWHKKRHNKRRFVCSDNLKMLHGKLTKNGIINIATDHDDYFQWMLEHIELCDELFEKIDYIFPAGAEEGEMAGTNFERKYLKEGRTVNTVAIRKK